MADKNDGYRQTKIEKTGDKTFNIHNERGDVFECNAPAKLDKLKNVSHLKSETQVFSGIGEKAELICHVCSKKVLKLSGKFDKTVKKIVYLCENCN